MLRRLVTGALEEARNRKEIGSSLEAAPVLFVSDPDLLAALEGIDMAEVSITSGFHVRPLAEAPENAFRLPQGGEAAVVVERREPAEMRPLVEDIAAGGRRSGLPRRDAARRRGAARIRRRRRAAEAARIRLAEARKMPSAARAFGLATAAIAVGLDQAHKAWMLGPFALPDKGRVTLTPFLDLVMVWNRGISYGLLSQDGGAGRLVLIGIGLAGAILFGWWLWTTRGILAAASLGLIIGGALSNVIDRVAPWRGGGFLPVPCRQLRMVCLQPRGCLDRRRRGRPGAELGDGAPRKGQDRVRSRAGAGAAGRLMSFPRLVLCRRLVL